MLIMSHPQNCSNFLVGQSHGIIIGDNHFQTYNIPVKFNLFEGQITIKTILVFKTIY